MKSGRGECIRKEWRGKESKVGEIEDVDGCKGQARLDLLIVHTFRVAGPG